MIASLLVANRGEIARRIMRTCRRLGIRTIAIYSDADARSLHVVEADEAFPVGPAPAAASYLNQSAILAIAASADARAIHPGYGFLAENADFAQACLDGGFVWVGPPPSAMRLVGDKARARALATQNGVPVLDGEDAAEQSSDVLAEHARRIGFPVMIKAAAGGGGRGMRVVQAAEDFSGALDAAKREAAASFGDDRVLLEQYVRMARHVEVQILGDRHGRLVHLGERECSVQRRHQKLVEETPSPAVDAALRSAMTDAALRLGRAAGYVNAGTVEFLLGDDGRFAFLEVNARLQVEHPITEAVTGLDLVELQLRIADGERLPLAQSDVRFAGHAIEARVIAEDPLAGFLPSSGTIERFRCPPGVRVDGWVRDGSAVSPYYDSLLAKVTSHASTRADALGGLARALEEMQVDGIKHNVDLLLAVVQHPAFASGDLQTTFLDDHAIVDGLGHIPPPVLAAASGLDALAPARAGDVWHTKSGWRIARLDQPSAWSRAGRPHTARVSAEPGGNGVTVELPERALSVRWLGSTPAGTRLGVEGWALTVRERGPDRRIVEWQGRSFRLERPPPLSIDAARATSDLAVGSGGGVTAPMPGRVADVAVSAGQVVAQHQPLLVLEAMKMEHVIEAPRSGVVLSVAVQVGDQVPGGAQLVSLGPLDAEQKG